jgi:hypothetical protein
MKKLLMMLMLSTNAQADYIQAGINCSYGAPISAVYQQADGTWVIQVYGGINAVNGSDLVVDHSQLVFKGFKGTKSLADFKLGWQVEDKGLGGIGNNGQCDYTLTDNSVYVIKK